MILVQEVKRIWVLLYCGAEVLELGEDGVVAVKLFGDGGELFVDGASPGHHAVRHVNESTNLMQVVGSTVEMKKRVQGKKEVGKVEEERRREGQRRKKEFWPKDSRLSHSCCI